jgi:23S rRNA (pseudouridine1915-N3)-methyltransferase
MRVVVVAVGGPSRLLAPPIREFESRAERYWKLETDEVSAERASKNRPIDDIKRAEGERIRAAIADGLETVALTRSGRRWSSRDLARYLGQLAVTGSAGAAFLIGGAYGLHDQLLGEARHRVSLSGMTMPHELARLVLAEQLYRAGTIVRGEPYHKG